MDELERGAPPGRSQVIVRATDWPKVRFRRRRNVASMRTRAFRDGPRQTWVQWFEKARLEHPDSAPAGSVVVARLGDELLGRTSGPVISYGPSVVVASFNVGPPEETLLPESLEIEPLQLELSEGVLEPIRLQENLKNALDGDGFHPPLRLHDPMLDQQPPGSYGVDAAETEGAE